jgi:acetoin utilization protein AcuC
MPYAAPYYIGSEIYRKPAFGFNHPLNIVRHAAVVDLLHMLGWLDDQHFRESRPATVDQLLEFHSRAYVRALQYANLTGKVEPEVRERFQVGTFENPLFPGLFERASMTVGGSILSAELASQGHVVFHNDPVFAILTFLKAGSRSVLYIDLDAHHGDGVEDAFLDEERVTTLSIHEAERWPFSGTHSRPDLGTFNLAVPQHINDAEFEFLFEQAVLPLVDKVGADALVLCCGADCLAGDPLSKMELSNVVLWDAVDRLIGTGLPTVILGGGGYNPWTVTRYWAGMWGRISGREFPERLPDEAIDYLTAMECDLIDEDEVQDAWLTTLADSPNRGPVRDAIRLLLDAT